MNALVIDTLFLVLYLWLSAHVISKKSGNLDFWSVVSYLFVCGLAVFAAVVVLDIIFSFIFFPF